VRLHLLNANDQVLAEYLDLMEQDQAVHPVGGFGDIKHRNDAPCQKNDQEQTKAQQNSFFHGLFRHLLL
jgi:hypothetical protein